MKKEDSNWYASWFNTPYYHILYKDRDYEEASTFMVKLTNFLKLSPGAKILDLACGKGRHSKFLATLNYDVTGVDLSPLSIAEAKKHKAPNLHFAVHDMCEPYPDTFDAVYNLFTSFGYFENEADNQRTINAIKQELNKNGYGVIDFLNSNYIKENLVPKEEKIVDGVTFNIKREIKNDYIIKSISFTDANGNHTYKEKVKALTLNDFKNYFEKAGLTLKHTFGDYSLNPFNKSTSQRLILIFAL